MLRVIHRARKSIIAHEGKKIRRKEGEDIRRILHVTMYYAGVVKILCQRNKRLGTYVLKSQDANLRESRTRVKGREEAGALLLAIGSAMPLRLADRSRPDYRLNDRMSSPYVYLVCIRRRTNGVRRINIEKPHRESLPERDSPFVSSFPFLSFDSFLFSTLTLSYHRDGNSSSSLMIQNVYRANLLRFLLRYINYLAWSVKYIGKWTNCSRSGISTYGNFRSFF